MWSGQKRHITDNTTYLQVGRSAAAILWLVDRSLKQGKSRTKDQSSIIIQKEARTGPVARIYQESTDVVDGRRSKKKKKKKGKSLRWYLYASSIDRKQSYIYGLNNMDISCRASVKTSLGG